MNDNFSRVLALLRQEKGISQRKAANELGISQALLSHYENGIREPGLEFVVKVCDFYQVSADYLLGRTLTRDAVISAEDVANAAEATENLRGNILAKLQKKLLVNSVCVLFDLLAKLGNREAVTHASAYLSSALYQLYRLFYRQAGGNDNRAFDMDIVSAGMTLSRIRYARALEDREFADQFPVVDAQTLAMEYPGFSQSVTQVLHTVDEQVREMQK